jgi:hypothetical protein
MKVEVYWDSLGKRVRREGLLVADELLDGYGLMVLGKMQISPQDTGLTPINILFIRSLRRMADGRVVLDDYRTPMSGYQTRNGFFLIGSGRDTGGDHYILRAHATETPVALSKDYGMYDATWESRWRSDTSSTQSTRTLQWVGGVAVVTFNDSIYVSIALKNESGGDTGFEAKDALASDGSFILAHKNGSWLKGSVHAGLLIGEFHDQREKAYFTGPLRATRK